MLFSCGHLELIQAFQRSARTDLRTEQINQLECLANQMNCNDSVLDAYFDIPWEYMDHFQQNTKPDPNLFINTTP